MVRIGTTALIYYLLVALTGLTPRYAEAEVVKLRYRSSIYLDAQDQPLQNPEGVAYLEGSGLMVADTGNSRLLVYRAEGDSLYLNEAIVELPQLKYPSKIQISAQGTIYTLDRGRLRVVAPAANRQFKALSTIEGSPPAAVKSFALDRTGNLYILYLSDRVRVFDRQERLLREIAFPADDVFLSDISVDANGRLLAVDGVAGIVYAAGPADSSLVPITDSLKQYARFPTRITTDARGRIYLSDRNGCRILVLGQDGSFLTSGSTRGWKDGLLQFPAQISIDGDTLYIADTRNHRIQVFTISE